MIQVQVQPVLPAHNRPPAFPGWAPPEPCAHLPTSPPAGMEFDEGDDINQLLEGITNSNLSSFW
jgi:hypothetical protein